MLALALRGLTARKLRGFLTALAIFFGVAMIAGTLMLTDRINNSFDNIFSDANRKVDVSVKPTEAVKNEASGQPPAFSADLLERVKQVDGVEAAAGTIFDYTIAILDEKGDRIGPMGPPHIAASVPPDRFTPWSYAQGRPPQKPGEAAMDRFTAKEEGYKLGDSVRIAGSGDVRRFRITGIARFGSDVPLGGASIAIFTLPEAQRLTNKVGKLDEIQVAGKPGTSPEQLKAKVDAALPPSVTVRTGKETAADESQDIKSGFAFFSTALLVFGLVALLVGGFLIFNTFSITVAQRTQEFGMLRTLGASARQVLGNVVLEAIAIGLTASLAGVLGGIAFVAGLTGLFSALGFELPTGSLIISGRTILVALVVGLVSTVLASAVPAIRATRVTPLEALRHEAGAERPRPRPRRNAAGTVLLLLGCVSIAYGLFAVKSFGQSFVFLGLGLVLLFIGVAMLSSGIIRPLASAIGWPMEKLRGITGLLARENTLRNPGRTTTTAAALMIGVALITFVATFAAALGKSFDDALARAFAGDLVLQNSDNQTRVPAGVVDRVAKVPGVETVSPLASGPGSVHGVGKETVSGMDPDTIGKVANLDWKQGSDATLRTLGTNGAIAEENWADDNGFGVGDSIKAKTPIGKEAVYQVRGIARDRAGLVIGSFAIPRDTMAKDFGITGDDVVLVGFAPGLPFTVVRNRVDNALTQRFPNVESNSQQELKDNQREQINQLLVLIYALLALSVLISLFGVVNTLVLTIHERTRELGMLRAIGTSRSQVRRMVRYESVITAMIGAVIGAVIGLVLAIVAVKALEHEGFVLSIPYPLLVVLLILTGVAGVAAAIAPARRASRINIIEALQYE